MLFLFMLSLFLLNAILLNAIIKMSLYQMLWRQKTGESAFLTVHLKMKSSGKILTQMVGEGERQTTS
jgi:hypothetical protein